jgi:hypothetical protein
VRLNWIGERTRPRVLVAAPRRNEIVRRLRRDVALEPDNPPFVNKVRDGEGAFAGTRGARAPQINRRATFQ